MASNLFQSVFRADAEGVRQCLDTGADTDERGTRQPEKRGDQPGIRNHQGGSPLTTRRYDRKASSLLFLLSLSFSALAEEPVARYASQRSIGQVSKYPAFAKMVTSSLTIPGLSEGFVPQGICRLPGRDWLLFSGYQDDGIQPSPLIAVDAKTGVITRQARLRNVEGTVFNLHSGGVTATEKTIYVSVASKLFAMPVETFVGLPADRLVDCSFTHEIAVPCRASYCGIANGVLWVGEFESGEEFPTDPDHHTTVDGEELTGWICGYDLRSGEPREPTGGTAIPDYVLRTTNRIQGMTILDGRIWLSQSYGRRNDSHLLVYKDPRGKAPDDQIDFGERKVPAWNLSKSERLKIIEAPPMTENLCVDDGTILVVFESGATKFVGASRPMDRAYRIAPVFTPKKEFEP